MPHPHDGFPAPFDPEHLPACLALIPHAWLSDTQRRALCQRAQQSGTAVDTLLLAEGVIPEVQFYQWIADHLGLDFATTPLLVLPPTHPREALAAGMVRLDPAHHSKDWLAAPQGRRLEQLLTQPRSSNQGLHKLVITTPSLLFQSLMQSCVPTLTHALTDALHQKKPDFSCRSLCLTLRARLIPVAGALAMAGLACLGGMPLSTLSTLFLFPLLILRIILLSTPVQDTVIPAPLVDKDWPIYSILVPLYRDATLLPQIITSLLALDYPADRRQVFLLLEQDDQAMHAALHTMQLPYGFQTVVLPAGLPRTKPRALNVGLSLATGSLIVVYDAEDRPDPQQLRHAAQLFVQSPQHLACLQAPLVIDNGHHGWLAHLFALEYAGLFDCLLPRLTQKNWPVPLGGSSNHFRRDALIKAGGWDAWNVTEDADLGLRLHRLGYRTACLPCPTYEDAPTCLQDWLMQRRRWIKGWIMTSAVHLRHPIHQITKQGFAHFLLYFAQSLGLAATVLLWPLTVIGLPWDWLNTTPATPLHLTVSLVVILSLPVVLGPLVLGAKRRQHPLSLTVLLSLPFYFLLMTAAGWAGLWEYLLKPHHWNKTPHSLHRP